MRFAAITNPGLESVTELEIKEILGIDSEKKESIVFFDTSFEEACRLTYKAQSIHKVLAILHHFEFDTLEDIEKVSLKTDWLTDSFAARCTRYGDHPFSSKDVEERVGARLKEENKAPVDLDNPVFPVHIHIRDTTCTIGIDLAGIDLSKRSYMLFTNRLAIKGTIAYGLARLAGFTGNGTLVDPFSRSGIIPIESTLYAKGLSPHFFNKDHLAFQYFPQFKKDPDKWFEEQDQKKENTPKIIGYDSMLRNVKAANKNAKIAGIHKALNFSRVDISWLDTKHSKGEIDYLVTIPPQMSRHKNPKEIQKIYTELFHQLDFVLGRKAVLLTRNPADLIDDRFKVIEEIPISQGQESFFALILQKA
ncbi:MAG: THUMP domain-containing protein [Candidatus Woesearchaeota archaeon]